VNKGGERIEKFSNSIFNSRHTVLWLSFWATVNKWSTILLQYVSFRDFNMKCVGEYSGAHLSTLVLHQWSIEDLRCPLLEFSSHFHLFGSSWPPWTRLNFEWKVAIFKTIKSLVDFRLTHSVFLISFLVHYNRFHRSFVK